MKPANADELTVGELTVYYDEAGNLYDVNAEGRTAVKLSIEMEYGASVRIVGNNGIRFMTKVDKSFDELSDEAKANVSFGTLIGPTYLIGDELNFDDVANYTAQNIPQTDAGWHANYTADAHCYTAALTELATSALNMNFTALGYMTITYQSGETETVFAKLAEAKDGDIYATNSRSLKYVADKCLADPEANLGTDGVNALTSISEMNEDGAKYDASIGLGEEVNVDLVKGRGKAYSVAFDGNNALSFDKTYLYNEFMIKFDTALPYSAIKNNNVSVLDMNDNIVLSNLSADTWYKVLVSGTEFSVNQAVNANVCNVTNCDGSYLVDKRSNILSEIELNTLSFGGVISLTDESFRSADLTRDSYQAYTRNGVVKDAYAYSLPQCESARNIYLNITDIYTKAELQTMLDNGYTKLNFASSITWDDNVLIKGSKITVSHFDFATVAMVNDVKDTWIGKGNSETKKPWWEVSYQVSDLINNYEFLQTQKLWNINVGYNATMAATADAAKILFTDFVFENASYKKEVIKIYNSKGAWANSWYSGSFNTTDNLEYKSFTLQGETKEAYQYTISTKTNTDTYLSVDLIYTYSKEDLQALVDAGKTTLDFSIALYYDSEELSNKFGDDGARYKVYNFDPNSTSSTKLTSDSTNGYWIPSNARPVWHNISVDLQMLIDNYDSIFAVSETNTKKAGQLCGIMLPKKFSDMGEGFFSFLVTDMILN